MLHANYKKDILKIWFSVVFQTKIMKTKPPRYCKRCIIANNYYYPMKLSDDILRWQPLEMLVHIIFSVMVYTTMEMASLIVSNRPILN